MLKISKKDYQDAIAYLHGIKDANYRVFFFEEVEVVVAEDGRKIYINDRTGERSKFYKLDSEAIISIYMALRTLYLREIDVIIDYEYRDINSARFLFEPINFDYKTIRELVFSIEKAKYIYKKK